MEYGLYMAYGRIFASLCSPSEESFTKEGCDNR